jgi:DNA-binding NarL/FixJ family response regulator
MTVSVRVLLADGHPVVRLGVRQILREHFHSVEVGEAGSGAEVLQRLQDRRWDLLILAINLPDRNGLDLLPEIRAVAPALPVLVLTIHGEAEYGLRVLQHGAAGYVTKDSSPETIALAVERILAGGRYVSSTLAARLATHLATGSYDLPHETLSSREFQVLRLLASGLSVAEIAAALTLHVRTIGTFRRSILRKLQLNNTQEIVYYAIRHGLAEAITTGRK